MEERKRRVTEEKEELKIGREGVEMEMMRRGSGTKGKRRKKEKVMAGWKRLVWLEKEGKGEDEERE